jgi:long-chain acyl-CoA synthetase
MRSLRTLDRSLTEMIEIAGRTIPDQPALLFEDRALTYRESIDAMRRVAAYVRERKIEPGDRVALHLDNRPEFAIVAGGVLMAGGVVVALNVMYLDEEVAYILENSGAKIVFALDALAGRSLASRAKLGDLQEVVAIGKELDGCTPFSAALERAPLQTSVPRQGGDLALRQYTSGTTGRPKGAMLTHRNVGACLDMMADVRRSAIADGDVALVVLPLFHCYGLILGLFGCYAWGVRTVLVNRFDAVEIFRAIEKHRATLFYGAPPMYVAFVNTPGLDRFDVSSVTRWGSGAAPLPLAVFERFQSRTGHEIIEGYGLTESSPTLTTNGNADVSRPGTVGKPLDGVEIRIVDDAGRDVPEGEIGEVIARGENIFVGYWNDPAGTREALRDGWLYTGDMGRRDADGYISIVDRKKDMVIVSGFNVYPIEVENVLFRHPKVADVAVIGVPDSYQGESVRAVVVPRPGEPPSEEEIIAFAREHLAAYKTPRSVVLVPSLPKNRTGKVLKRVLREQFSEGSPASKSPR